MNNTNASPPPPLKAQNLPLGRTLGFCLFLLLLPLFFSDCSLITGPSATSTDTTPPTLTNHSFTIYETNALGSLVGTVKASDNVGIATYEIVSGDEGEAFAIDNSGRITIAADLDYEKTSDYSLGLRVADAAGNPANATVNIEVIKVDSSPPIITNHHFSILEDATNGTVVGRVRATDNEGVTSYAITAGNTDTAFAIDNNGLLITAAAIDYETSSNYSLTVQVADNAGNTSNATITINVILVDKVAPTITNQAFTIGDDASVGDLLGRVSATDNVGVTAYAITAGDDASVFAISNTGEITTAKALDAADGNYNLTVEVADAADNKSNATITINVTDKTDPVITNQAFTIGDDASVGDLVGRVKCYRQCGSNRLCYHRRG